MLADLPKHVAEPDPSIYWRGSYVVLDFETTTHLKGSPLSSDNRVVLACWYRVEASGNENQRVRGAVPHADLSCNRGPLRVIRGSEFDLGELARDIAASDFIVSHNAKFECGWLKRAGIDLRKVVVFDTLLADYVIGGNLYGLHELGLDACLRRYKLPAKESTVSRLIKSGVPVEDIPASWLSTYCQRDVEAAGELFLLQRQRLQDLGLEAVFYQRCLVTPCLADIEFNGMQLDNDEVLRKVQHEEEEYARLTRELERFCNGASPSSTPQMRDFIYADLGFDIPKDFRGEEIRTASGEPSVAAPVLERLVAKTARQREFLRLRSEWAGLHSDLTKYLRKFESCVTMDGGLLHGNFNQANTRTHRLSSSGVKHRVQFQNFNRSYKPLFRARCDGWVVGEADGAQLEFRTATHLGRDRVALADILQRVDIHSYTASIIGCSRQDAKPHTFKPLYGGMSGTDAERRYYEAFKSKYTGIAQTQERWTQSVLRDKYLVTESGLRYYWPDTRLSKSGYITNTTSIYNYPVQGFATADIIPIALVCAWHRIRGLRLFLVNTVHDSIVAEIPPEEIETWHEVAKQCLIVDVYDLLKRLYNVEFTVPLGAGVTVGTQWGNKEAKASEVVYEADPSLYESAAKAAGML